MPSRSVTTCVGAAVGVYAMRGMPNVLGFPTGALLIVLFLYEMRPNKEPS